MAAFVPKGRKISRQQAKNGFIANPDGAGFCYSQDGQLITKKGFFTFNEFWSEFSKINGLYPSLVHFRYATHGALNEFNCHPWPIDDNHAMVHNGVIKGFGHLDNGRSDTGDFTEMILKPMLKDNPVGWKSPWFKAMMSRALGTNKIAIMNDLGEVAIYGENLGVWDNITKCWFSNHDYLAENPK